MGISSVEMVYRTRLSSSFNLLRPVVTFITSNAQCWVVTGCCASILIFAIYFTNPWRIAMPDFFSSSYKISLYKASIPCVYENKILLLLQSLCQTVREKGKFHNGKQGIGNIEANEANRMKVGWPKEILAGRRPLSNRWSGCQKSFTTMA